jgi:hypothetical protein
MHMAMRWRDEAETHRIDIALKLGGPGRFVNRGPPGPGAPHELGQVLRRGLFGEGGSG